MSELLWREAVGRVLRHRRHDRGEKLSEVARRARVSAQYLSEVERGRKDPSSEVLIAILAALELTLLDLTYEVSVVLGQAARLTSTRSDSVTMLHRTPRVQPGHSRPLALAS